MKFSPSFVCFSIRNLFQVVACCLMTAIASAQLADPESRLEELGEKYRIKIVTEGFSFPVEIGSGKIDGKDADGQDLKEYISLFVEEFSLYPPALIERSKLERIVLCGGLSFAGQYRAAIPDFANNTLYFDVSRGRNNPNYQRKVIHHEYYHIIDYRDDGLLYQDDRWAALNPADFSYGTGGKNAQHLSNTSVLTDRFPGFLNHYSTTGVEEDKAEIFANLMVEPEYVYQRASKDKVLAAKVALMKELMFDFCPAIDEKFWKKINSFKRPSQ